MLPKLFFISMLSSFILTHSHTQCLDNQKTLLLQLKNELIFDSSYSTKLVNWNQTDDCCSWYGVGCDGAGNVVSLDLDDEAISGGIGDSSTLFRLMHLQKLNLAYNNFISTPIPKGIHNLTYLTHFNLSNAGFGGQVPAEISSLRRLVSLDICNDYWDIEPLRLEHPSLEMLLHNMTGLRELYLDGVFLSSHERRKWSHIVSSYLPNLTGLSLVWCSLSGPLAKSFSRLHSLSILRLDSNDLSLAVLDLFANFSSLTTLRLFNCGLKGSFPNMILQIPTLQYLDLSGNEQLSGSIPPFAQTGSLKSLVLSGTNFSGLIPSSISHHKDLFEINLGGCKFTGSLPSTFGNLTELIYVNLSYNFFTGSISSLFGGLLKLVRLDLSANSFSGNLPHSVFTLPSLEELYLSKNQFVGFVEEFPTVNGSNIAVLDLSSNRLEGPIPNSFFQLESLGSLLLFENLFNGTFQLDKIQSLANLGLLDLSDNNLSVVDGNNNNNISSSYGILQLNELRLASCNLHHFPNIIKSYDLSILDMSNNRIAGEVPSWIWGTQLQFLNLSFNLLIDFQKPYHIPASLQLLDLQSNQLQGKLHLLIPPNIGNLRSLQYLLLASNNLSGSIPTSLCSATKLNVLDLSVNKLSGNIAPCLLENIRVVLDLGQNNISGRIPDNFPLNCSLQYLDLNNNAFEGKIPKSLESCKLLEFMNVGNNNINDSFPCMLSSSLRVLVLHSNRFHGEVRCRKRWPDLQIVDVSSNNFSGSLESINLSSWRAMAVLDSDAQLRHNGLTSNVLKASSYHKVGVRLVMKGQAVELVKIWPDFTAIDFSCNNFQGGIPNAIGDLSSLRLLNFSHNAMNESIPKSFGQLRVLESLDLSRNQLMGAIPTELAGLTFLSVLNLSYNKLVGRIPNGPQFQTFSADSFKGNPGLCGFNLNISCNHSDDRDLSPPEHENVDEEREIEWEYVCAALGYVVGLGSIAWLLLFCRRFREKYYGKIDEIVEEIFNGRVRRRRRAKREARNRTRRQ